MKNKFNRNSIEYQLAEEIVFHKRALNLANKILNDDGKFGVLPDQFVSFREGANFHKEVRNVIKKYK